MTLDRVLASLDGGRIRAATLSICADFPSRLPGSEAAAAVASFTRDAMREAGLEAAIHCVPGPVSFPLPTTLEVLAPAAARIAAHAAAHSAETGKAGVAGILRDVGGADPATLAQVATQGAILLTDLACAPSRQEKRRLCGEAGARGMVMMNFGPEDGRQIPLGSVKGSWGLPDAVCARDDDPQLPCIGISRADGLALRAACARGEVMVRFRTQPQNRMAEVAVTLGQTEGTEDFVLVGGHQDSWFGAQATDNAVGTAVLLELARAFARVPLRRALRFGHWAGHETGGMIGSSWFADMHWAALRRHGAAYVEVDQPGCAGATVWKTMSSLPLRDFHTAVEERMLCDTPRAWQPCWRTGDASFHGVGLPHLRAAATWTAAELAAGGNATYGWWHHSTANTPEHVNFDSALRHARVYAAYLWELCTQPILPFRHAALAETIKSGAMAASVAEPSDATLREVASLATSVAAAARRLDAALDALRDGGCDSDAAARANGVQRRLNQSLLPLAHTRHGAYRPDRYGDIGLAAPVPALQLLRESHDEPNAVAARRARNRVFDALDQADRLLAAEGVMTRA